MEGMPETQMASDPIELKEAVSGGILTAVFWIFIGFPLLAVLALGIVVVTAVLLGSVLQWAGLPEGAAVLVGGIPGLAAAILLVRAVFAPRKTTATPTRP